MLVLVGLDFFGVELFILDLIVGCVCNLLFKKTKMDLVVCRLVIFVFLDFIFCGWVFQYV